MQAGRWPHRQAHSGKGAGCTAQGMFGWNRRARSTHARRRPDGALRQASPEAQQSPLEQTQNPARPAAHPRRSDAEHQGFGDSGEGGHDDRQERSRHAGRQRPAAAVLAALQAAQKRPGSGQGGAQGTGAFEARLAAGTGPSERVASAGDYCRGSHFVFCNRPLQLHLFNGFRAGGRRQASRVQVEGCRSMEGAECLVSRSAWHANM